MHAPKTYNAGRIFVTKKEVNVPAPVGANNGNGNDDDMMEWTKELEYKQLLKNIRNPNVKRFLEDADKLDIATIHKIREQLTEFRQSVVDDSVEQWEAFHLDMYYETAVQRMKLQFDVCYSDLSESDNVNENEEEKQSVTD